MVHEELAGQAVETIADGRWCEAISLGDALLRTAAAVPEQTALVMPEGEWTWAELAAASERVARGLVSLGLRPGAHVGVLIPNSFECLSALFGVALAGCAIVPINGRFKAPEVRYIVEHADLAAVLTSDLADDYVDFVGLLGEALPDLAGAADPAALELTAAPALRSVVLLGDKHPAGLLDRAGFAARADTVDPAEIERRRAGISLRDPCMVLYTSGTTANPKGALISHESLVRIWTGSGRNLRLGPQDTMWNPCPMFHIAAIGVCIACVVHGTTIVTTRFFHPDSTIEVLRRVRATAWFPAYPPIMIPVVTHPQFAEVDTSGLARLLCVGPPEVLRKLQATVPHAVLISTFGMTESCGCSTLHVLDDPLDVRMTTAGLPLPGLEVRIADPTGGPELMPAGTPGEIQLRGPVLFDGYYKDPENTALTLGADGWMRTGDHGVLDEGGRLNYLGRIKDMLKVGGENVSPAQVEGHLVTHPSVRIAQVVGAPDERLDEIPVAFVELEPGAAATEEELIEHCRGHLARFKVPRHVRIIEAHEWPMSATKVQKYRLRERIVEELAAGPAQR